MNPMMLYNNRYLIYNGVVLDLQRARAIDVEVPEDSKDVPFIHKHYFNFKDTFAFDKLPKYRVSPPTDEPTEPTEIVFTRRKEIEDDDETTT